MKRITTIILLSIFLMFSLVSCKDKTNAKGANDKNKDEVQEELTTKAKFKSKNNSATNGFIDCLFIDSEGSEFIAIIGENTKLPTEGLVEGKTYKIHHSNVQTSSLPPQLPEVFSVELIEE